MYSLKSFCIMWLLLCIISEILSSDLLHFGGTDEESRQASYYLSADSGTNTGPTDELKRTQRSFWKKLFKKWEPNNCCNNCDYNEQNCNTASAPLCQFQPMRLWRPFKPLFGNTNFDNYGTSCCTNGNSNNYENPPSYGSNGVITPPTYDNIVPPAPETTYEIPTELPPVDPNYKMNNIPATEGTYEPSSIPAVNENSYNNPKPSTYSNDETAKVLPYSNGKLPQIIYQPIIYVSPQYQANKDLKQITEEEITSSKESDYDKPQPPSYEVDSDSKSEQRRPYADNAKSNGDNFVYNAPETNQQSEIATPCSQSITVPYTKPSNHCLNCPLEHSPVSTVSTVYNIISPSLLHSLTGGQSSHDTSNDPSKYSLYTTNDIPLDRHFLPEAGSDASYANRPLSSTQSYLQPMTLTSDDQPYRVCPELFDEYHRKINTMVPRVNTGKSGSTFVNAQLIHYR